MKNSKHYLNDQNKKYIVEGKLISQPIKQNESERDLIVYSRYYYNIVLVLKIGSIIGFLYCNRNNREWFVNNYCFASTK